MKKKRLKQYTKKVDHRSWTNIEHNLPVLTDLLLSKFTGSDQIFNNGRTEKLNLREKTQYLIKTLYVIQHTAYDSSELLSSYLNLSWWHSSHSRP